MLMQLYHLSAFKCKELLVSAKILILVHLCIE